MRLTHPAVVLAVLWLIWVGLDRVLGRAKSRVYLVLGVGVAAIGLAAYAAIVVWYARQPAFFDPAEPTITAVSYVFALGKPLYPALDAPERYAHIYGPALFIIHAVAMRLFGAHVLVSKAVGALSALAGVLLTYLAFVRIASRRTALLAVGLCALVYLDFGNTTFWDRPEPLLILCTAVSLYGVVSESRRVYIVLLAVAFAVSWNLKISGPLYILPAFSLLLTRSHWRDALVVVAIAIGLAVMPFLIPTVSFGHYIGYIHLSARNGLMAAKLRQNAEWAFVLMAPLGISLVWTMRGTARRQTDLFVATLVASLLVIVVIASKPGAGPYHLLPAVPAIALAGVRLAALEWEAIGVRTITAALITTVCVFAVPSQFIFIQTLRGRDVSTAAADVRAFLDAHPAATVGVGYAGTSRWSDARVEAVFRTHDYWLDAPAVQEYRLAGFDVPDAVFTALATCRTEYWLIPSDGAPFDVPSAYWPGAGPQRVFSEHFRDVFLHTYRQVGKTRDFDVWECRR